MRKLLIAALLLAAPACKRAQVKHVDTVMVEEQVPRLASSFRMGDATMAKQLAGGFYDIESGAWRWTMQKFAVTLGPPPHAAQQGAVLELHLTVPQSSIQKLGSVTLSASIGGTVLAPETYTQPGEHVYRRDVAANLLAADAVRVDFGLDKAIPPGDVDKRELGVVASSVGFVARP
jgi:hypothetical protein